MTSSMPSMPRWENRSGARPPAAPVASSPAVANGVVYVGSVDGSLHAFSLPPAEPPARPNPATLKPDLTLLPALSENLTKRPLLRNFLHPLNCEEPTLVTAIRLAMDERHRSGWFERDAEGAGLRLNWAGHGERLDEGVGIPGLSG